MSRISPMEARAWSGNALWQAHCKPSLVLAELQHGLCFLYWIWETGVRNRK